MDKTLPPR